MNKKIRVVIADDQSLITDSFKVLLETTTEDIVVVGTARDGREAIDVVAAHRPDVVLMDVRMPVTDGVQATEEIHRAFPEVKIIMLTTFDDDAYVHDAIIYGAAGYLLKDTSTEELVSSIRAVNHGAVLVSASVAHKLFGQDVARTPGGDSQDRRISDETLDIIGELSNRELEILKLIARGLENKEIAERLFAAEQTIKNSVSIVYTKLGVENRREARRFALKAGIVGPDEFLST